MLILLPNPPEGFFYKVRLLKVKNNEYVSSETRLLGSLEELQELIENQPQDMDISIYPYFVNADGSKKLVFALFLDIDYAKDEAVLESFYRECNFRLRARPVYVYESSPNRYYFLYLFMSLQENTETVFPSYEVRPHLIAHLRIAPILDKYKGVIQVDKNSFNPEHPFKLPYTFNHKRGCPTKVVKEYLEIEGVRRAIDITRFSQEDFIDLYTNKKGRPKKEVNVEIEEQIWIEALNLLGREVKEWREKPSGDAYYMMVNCVFHPPDKHPSAALFKTRYGILYIDFHDGNKYSVGTFLREVVERRHELGIPDETVKKLIALKHRYYKTAKHYTQTLKEETVKRNLQSIIEDQVNEAVKEELELIQEASNIVLEKLKSIVKGIEIAFTGGEFMFIFSLSIPKTGETKLFIDKKKLASPESFFKEIAVYLVDTPFNIMYKLFGDIIFLKEFRKVLQLGYARWLDYLSEQYETRDRSHLPTVLDAMIKEIFNRIRQSFKDKRFRSHALSPDKEGFQGFFNTWLKNKDLQVLLPVKKIKEDIYIPLEALKIIVSFYQASFLGADFETVKNILLQDSEISIADLDGISCLVIPIKKFPDQSLFDEVESETHEDKMRRYRQNIFYAHEVKDKTFFVLAPESGYYKISTDSEEALREFLGEVINGFTVKCVLQSPSLSEFLRILCDILGLQVEFLSENEVVINPSDVGVISSYVLSDVGDSSFILDIEPLHNQEEEVDVDLS